ncbi:MAG TPA: LysM domain-containing protein, partial [Spirochaetia bacterium]|nr:LysM domain-containing protein [Spirochaetia bacterium]
ALFAAAIVILLAACVVAGLHLGVLRPRTAGTSAAQPMPAQPVPAKPVPAPPATAKQDVTTGAETSSGRAATIYVVKKGDTLWDIAARFTGNAHNYHILAADNGIANPDVIEPGQEIKLPR